MRKFFVAFVAVASLLPMVLVASPADAVGGTSCATTSGTATFNPPLPPLGSKTLVNGTFTAIGTVGKCTGGGVTSGHTKFVSNKGKTGSNCTTLATSTTPTTGTLTITWNTGKTSTLKLTLNSVKGKVTERKITGPVTAGLFKGSTQTSIVTYAIPSGFCKTALKSLKYSQVGASVIK